MSLRLHPLVLGLILILPGCGPNKPNPEAAKAERVQVKVGIVYDAGGLGDKAFNDSAAKGIARAKKELGIEVLQLESKHVKDYALNLKELAKQSCDLVVAIGYDMQDDTEAVAKEFPQTKFALVDATVSQTNVRGLLFKEEEGSYLVGFLAGMMTKSGKIGFIGGEDMPQLQKYEAGYIAGAKSANRAVVVTPSQFIGSGSSEDDAAVVADSVFGQGVDIVFCAAGSAGLGVIRSAAKHDKFAIGVDSDQDYLEPGHVLTSMVKHVDVAVFETIKDFTEGTFAGGKVVYDLADGGVGVSPLTYTKESIGKERIARLEDAYRAIADGTVRVPTSMQEMRMFEKIANSMFD